MCYIEEKLGILSWAHFPIPPRLIQFARSRGEKVWSTGSEKNYSLAVFKEERLAIGIPMETQFYVSWKRKIHAAHKFLAFLWIETEGFFYKKSFLTIKISMTEINILSITTSQTLHHDL